MIDSPVGENTMCKDNSMQAEGFCREDIIKRDYWVIPNKSNRKIKLFDFYGFYEDYTVWADVMTNKLSITNQSYDGCGRRLFHVENEIDSEGNIIGINTETYPELIEKFKSYKVSEQNWRDFVSAKELEDFENKLFKACRATVSVKGTAPRECYDFDAYYISSNSKMFGTSMAFLRRTENGWRGFFCNKYSFDLMAMDNHSILEQDIVDCFSYIRENLDERDYYCADRKLNKNDLAYVAEVMPKEHPLSRPDGKGRVIHEETGYYYDAYYLKEGRYIPCADIPNILEIKSRILSVSLYAQEYERPI